jgi:arginyl-tRNA synthetase
MESERQSSGLLDQLRSKLRAVACDLVRDKLRLELDPHTVAWETPPDPRFGDLSTPLPLRLAKQARRAPLAIAEELREAIAAAGLPLVASVSVTAPGYVNVRVDAAGLVSGVVHAVAEQREGYGALPRRGQKVVIEHTNMNPNKAAHIGHVRNACLGDTLVRILRRCGYEVEVQNYIDDTGAQVADVVLGIMHLGAKVPEDQAFDHFCWDLYSDVHRRYEREPELKETQREYLHSIESGQGEVASFAKQVAERVLAGHLATMWGLGIYYDVLTWESDIIRKGFWRHAFDTLRGRGSLVYEVEGPNAGCWVVRLRDVPEFAGLENPDKVLVRSNGTATYVAKDIAYQLWKFGVLGLDFDYRHYGEQPNGRQLYTSCPPAQAEELPDGAGGFGRADRVINVIDIRQKYLQDILRHSLGQLGYTAEAANSIHFGYEVVALSVDTARELGVEIDAEAKGVVVMAGRKGIGVKADDLIAAAVAKATAEVSQRHPEMSPEQVAALAHDIAVAAIRYYMVRFHTNTLIAFDFAEALAMNGHTGPYLQYAYARALSILRRAADSALGCPADPSEALTWSLARSRFDDGAELLVAERNIGFAMADFAGKLSAAAAELLPSILADYAFTLATSFTDFYEGAPVLSAAPEVQARRICLVSAFIQVMRNVLDTLGLPAPGVL